MTAFKQLFFYQDKFLGESSRGLCLRTNDRPVSTAFFCPICGEIWARAVVEGSRWYTKHVECSRCGKLGVINFPGSVWSPLDGDFNISLPREVLELELEIAIAWRERYGTLST